MTACLSFYKHYVLRHLTFLTFFPFSFFLIFFFAVSDWPSTVSSSKMSKKVSRWLIFAMEYLSLVTWNFALSFSFKFKIIFVHISDPIEPVTLVWVSMERSFPPTELGCKWSQFWSKVMMSEEEHSKTLITAGYSWLRSQ